MAGPEHLLDDGSRLGRNRSWMVFGVVLVVVVGLVVLRLGRSASATLPAPTQTPVAASSSAHQPWPLDLPRGTLVVAAAGWVYTIDTGSGALTRTRVQADPAGTSMTRLADGVLVWQVGSHARQLLRLDGLTLPVRGELRLATSFLPGPDGSVWAAQAPRPENATWRRVDVDGRPSTSVTVHGAAESDGAGGLLDVAAQGFRPTYPPPRLARQAGDVIATGPDGYVVRSCSRTGCRFTLHRRGDHPDTALTTAVGDDTSAGTLSPANRLLAMTETVGGTTTLRVSVVATGQIDDIFPAPKQSSNDAVWLDDRWLALISEDQLVLYDAAHDHVVIPAMPLSSIGPLAWKAG